MRRAAIVANRIFGYTPSMAKIPEPGQEDSMTFINARVVHNDQLAKRNLERVEQVVLMGAGFDLRLLGLSRGTGPCPLETQMSILAKVSSAAGGLRALSLVLGTFLVFMGLNKLPWLADSGYLVSMRRRPRAGGISRRWPFRGRRSSPGLCCSAS